MRTLCRRLPRPSVTQSLCRDLLFFLSALPSCLDLFDNFLDFLWRLLPACRDANGGARGGQPRTGRTKQPPAQDNSGEASIQCRREWQGLFKDAGPCGSQGSHGGSIHCRRPVKSTSPVMSRGPPFRPLPVHQPLIRGQPDSLFHDHAAPRGAIHAHTVQTIPPGCWGQAAGAAGCPCPCPCLINRAR